MVAAGVAIAAAAVVTAAVQAYNGAKARGAAQDQLNKIERIFKNIVPPELDLAIDDPPSYIQEQLSVALPNYDMSRITPEALELVAQYQPDTYEYIKEIAPELVEKSSEAQEGMQAQLDALRQLKTIAGQERDPELMAAMADAERRAQTQAQSRQASILQDFARRGQMGSGVQLAAQLSGTGQAMGDLASAERDMAAQAYRNRLQAMRDSANLGGQITGQELRQSEANAQIINAYNQRNTQRYQDYLARMADMQNQAKLRNLGERQRISDYNVQAGNEAKWKNAQRQDELIADLNQKQYGRAKESRDYANWLETARIAEKDRQNALRQQQFQNQMDILSARAGIGRDQSNMAMQTGQDYAQAIQGVGNAVSGYYQNQAENERYDKWGRAKYGDRWES